MRVAKKKRAEMLVEEIAELSLAKRIEVLRSLAEALKPLLDRTLDEWAEKIRPRGEMKETCVAGQIEIVGAVPAADVRLGMNARGGHDLLQTFMLATEEAR